MSVRTVVRDAIVAKFTAMQSTQAGRVQVFEVSKNWLLDTESKRQATYCVVVTDESRSPNTHSSDFYSLSGVVVIYAFDTADPRAKLDLMIEDAIDVLREAFRSLAGQVTRAMIDVVQATEGSTAEGNWPQAVVRWTAIHTRAVLA